MTQLVNEKNPLLELNRSKWNDNTQAHVFLLQFLIVSGF